MSKLRDRPQMLAGVLFLTRCALDRTVSPLAHPFFCPRQCIAASCGLPPFAHPQVRATFPRRNPFMGSGSMNLLLVCGAALLCLAPSRSLLRAQGTITGKVTAETGQPVAGAHVLVLGTTAAAVAAEDGKYTITNV